MQKPTQLLFKEILPNSNDVLLGRGRALRDHAGNRQFIQLVRSFKSTYEAAPKRHVKNAIAHRILNDIRARQGRFLEVSESTQWKEISTERALMKIKQALRDYVYRRAETPKGNRGARNQLSSPSMAIEPAKQKVLLPEIELRTATTEKNYSSSGVASASREQSQTAIVAPVEPSKPQIQCSIKEVDAQKSFLTSEDIAAAELLSSVRTVSGFGQKHPEDLALPPEKQLAATEDLLGKPRVMTAYPVKRLKQTIKYIPSKLWEMKQHVELIPSGDKETWLKVRLKARRVERDDQRMELFRKLEHVDPKKASRRFTRHLEDGVKLLRQ